MNHASIDDAHLVVQELAGGLVADGEEEAGDWQVAHFLGLHVLHLEAAQHPLLIAIRLNRCRVPQHLHIGSIFMSNAF